MSESDSDNEESNKEVKTTKKITKSNVNDLFDNDNEPVFVVAVGKSMKGKRKRNKKMQQ